MISTKDPAPPAPRLVALDLIRNQRTLILGTCADSGPWVAPVYFVFAMRGFCFFSSPRSEHIRHIRTGSAAAASIFSDQGRWRDIRGLQMRGTVHSLRRIGERLNVTGAFLLKFPFARDFLQAGGAVTDLSRSVQLYSFVPEKIYLVDNSTAFGRRLALDPDLLESAAQKEE